MWHGYTGQMTIEIVAQSLEDALAAERAGADRLELVSALSLGGLTPSIGTMASIASHAALPVVAMLRPRSGGFAYSASEIDTMVRDAEYLLQAGAKGLVFGVLDAQGHIDQAANRRLLEAAGNAETVFHRAFDVLQDPEEGVDILVDLGFTRILTSGGQETALEGAETIRRVIAKAAGRIEILVAGGVRPNNAQKVIAETGTKQIHFAGQEWIADPSTDQTKLAFNAPGHAENQYGRVDEQLVAEVRSLVGR